ncbi:hypothetical protein [Couchioplanes azureus]|uniref:hypothetical protein n=1 Tax=Couchioplanes caeruleus TaxID=56438 RepID=UPI0016705BF7|nr:hypothetical protein [Couchioplanes caeruleus]GGQ43797.1 hypothetical protein GCM10010166_10340 [Couchioplanes caeruleus subsp. azureus]
MSEILDLASVALRFAAQPDWIEAGATAVAAMGTVGAFYRQGKALRLERETRRAEIARLEDERLTSAEAQAKSIVVMKHRRRRLHDDQDVLVATVFNCGQLPVVKIHADAHIDKEGSSLRTSFDDVVPVLAPGQQVEISAPMPDYEDNLGSRYSGLGWRLHMDLKFGDLQGNAFTSCRGRIRRHEQSFLDFWVLQSMREPEVEEAPMPVPTPKAG